MLGIEVARGHVLPEWIDINDHMNVAYYLLAFDHAVDDLWHTFGLTEEYIRTHSSSTIAVESHVTWQREVVGGECLGNGLGGVFVDEGRPKHGPLCVDVVDK